MKLDLSSWMLILFIILFVLSVWKIYAFLPNKPLADDDTTKESQDELLSIIVSVIKKNDAEISSKELYLKVIEDATFDSKKFWRFNQNRLNQLLKKYYTEHKSISSIKDIYKS